MSKRLFESSLLRWRSNWLRARPYTCFLKVLCSWKSISYVLLLTNTFSGLIISWASLVGSGRATLDLSKL